MPPSQRVNVVDNFVRAETDRMFPAPAGAGHASHGTGPD